MNIKTAAKQWLIEHEHYEDEPCFNDDLESLVALLNSILIIPKCDHNWVSSFNPS